MSEQRCRLSRGQCGGLGPAPAEPSPRAALLLIQPSLSPTLPGAHPHLGPRVSGALLSLGDFDWSVCPLWAAGALGSLG